MNIRPLFLTVAILSFSFAVRAESDLTPEKMLEVYRNKFPDESGITTKLHRILTIKKSGDSLKVSADHYHEILVLAKPARWIKDRVYSSDMVKIEELEAYTLVPGKKKYKKVDVSDFKRSFDKNTYVFYDDTEVISFNYPQVGEGAKIVNSYSMNITDPHIINKFFLQSYTPISEVRYEIRFDDGIEINHKVLNDSLIDVTFSQEISPEGMTSYIYEAGDLPKIDFEDDNPGFAYLSPAISITVDQYETSEGNREVLSSLDNLHDWYRTFVADLHLDESLKELTQQIVDPSDSDLEKVRKIFYWVQQNIKYIAFEDGMRGFIPHKAQTVLNSRYGDCKDMASLLVALLKTEDLDAYYTWIGSRKIPYRYSDVPSPFVDDHMIASVKVGNETLFLDATGSYTPLGYPTSMIQGKECLISEGEDYRIETVPVVPKEDNLMADSSFVWLDEGTLRGSGKLRLAGLVKVANTYQLIQRTNKGEENYLRRLLSRGSNKFLLDDFEVHNLEDLDAPIEIDYEYNIEDYYREIGDELYINLCLDNSLANLEIKNRKTPKENDYNYITRRITVFEIPDGFDIQYLPENGKYSSEDVGYSIQYEVLGRKIRAVHEIYVNYLIMYPSRFEGWNQTLQEYARATRKTIVLKKKL